MRRPCYVLTLPATTLIITIGDGSHKPLGLRFPIELEPAVDAGDHEIEPPEDIVRILERAVGQNVGFDPLQNPEFLGELSRSASRCCSWICSSESPPA
jgi:hypothetical protein